MITATSQDSREQDRDREEAIRKLGGLIRDVKCAMLTTISPDGTLHSRPMATQEREFDGTLWFFTGLSTTTVAELRRNPEVNLSYANPEEMQYISVSGEAEVLRERDKMRELWSDAYRRWFPQGLDDPDLCLLKVEVTQAEYWNESSGKMAEMAGFLKAVTTGRREEPGGLGEHGELELEPKARGAAASLSGRSDDASEEIESHT